MRQNKLTPELFRETFAKNGDVISLETAVKIAEFMKLLAEVAVEDYLKQKRIIKPAAKP